VLKRVTRTNRNDKVIPEAKIVSRNNRQQAAHRTNAMTRNII